MAKNSSSRALLGAALSCVEALQQLEHAAVETAGGLRWGGKRLEKWTAELRHRFEAIRDAPPGVETKIAAARQRLRPGLVQCWLTADVSAWNVLRALVTKVLAMFDQMQNAPPENPAKLLLARAADIADPDAPHGIPSELQHLAVELDAEFAMLDVPYLPPGERAAKDQTADGPVAPNGFTWNDFRFEGLTGRPWLLVHSLWNAKGQTLTFEQLALPVWGETARPPSVAAVSSARRLANKFFRRWNVPLQVRVITTGFTATGRGYVVSLCQIGIEAPALPPRPK